MNVNGRARAEAWDAASVAAKAAENAARGAAGDADKRIKEAIRMAINER